MATPLTREYVIGVTLRNMRKCIDRSMDKTLRHIGGNSDSEVLLTVLELQRIKDGLDAIK